MALLEEISSFVQTNVPKSTNFCDLFAGTGSVGQNFKGTHKVVSNDLLYFCSVINDARITLSRNPRFLKLKKIIGADPIDYLNSIEPSVLETSELDFIFQEYSPLGKSRRQYLTSENALKIDRIRQEIHSWFTNEMISSGEHAYLLCSLIEAIPSVSNIAGTYGAYLKSWDRRAFKTISLEQISIRPSAEGARNLVFNENAEDLIKKINGEVLYLDPPYNGRQYAGNYHLLETVARYDYPVLSGITGTRKEKSGSSNFCKKGKVLNSFQELVKNADFGYIVVSYSSEGLLNEDELVESMSNAGIPSTLIFQKIPYRRYSRLSDNKKPELNEYLIGIRKR